MIATLLLLALPAAGAMLRPAAGAIDDTTVCRRRADGVLVARPDSTLDLSSMVWARSTERGTDALFWSQASDTAGYWKAISSRRDTVVLELARRLTQAGWRPLQSWRAGTDAFPLAVMREHTADGTALHRFALADASGHIVSFAPWRGIAPVASRSWASLVPTGDAHALAVVPQRFRGVHGYTLLALSRDRASIVRSDSLTTPLFVRLVPVGVDRALVSLRAIRDARRQARELRVEWLGRDGAVEQRWVRGLSDGSVVSPEVVTGPRGSALRFLVRRRADGVTSDFVLFLDDDRTSTLAESDFRGGNIFFTPSLPAGSERLGVSDAFTVPDTLRLLSPHDTSRVAVPGITWDGSVQLIGSANGWATAFIAPRHDGAPRVGRVLFRFCRDCTVMR